MGGKYLKINTEVKVESLLEKKKKDTIGSSQYLHDKVSSCG